MIHRIFAVVFAGLLVAAAPHPQAGLADSPTEPRAASWAVTIALPSAGQVLQIGYASASSGARPSASATSFMAGSQGTGYVSADLDHPDVTKDVRDFTDPALPTCLPPIPQAGLNNGVCDPGGNFSLRGGFAEAHVSSGSSSSQAGIVSGNGNGFAFASKNFSFDQQTQVLNAIQQVDDLLSQGTNGLPGVNTLIDKLNSATGVLQLPHLTGPPPAGLIDIADAGAISGNAQTSSAPGFVSSTSTSSIGDLKLIGGFIELHDVKASADSESNSGNDSRTATATVGSITIAGLTMVADSDGLHLATNNLLARAAAQPAIDMLMASLKQAGLTIAIDQTSALGDLRDATAFDLSWATPNGLVHISVGHADASAQTVGAPFAVAPPVVSGIVPPPIPPVAVPPAITPPTSTPPFLTPPGSTGGTGGKFFYRRPGPEVARALRTVYLIFLVGGFVGSLMYPMLIRRARPMARRRPLIALKGALQ